jgi:sugar phosphate isomerase/epimerase
MTRPAEPPLHPEPPVLDRRFGLNVPDGWWPTGATLKSIEAAGYGWVQVHTPPAACLRLPQAADHARALRAALDVGGLRVVLHGPDELVAGTAPSNRTLEAVLEYAARIRAELVVYHGANLPLDAPAGRLEAEVRFLRHASRRARALGLTLAAENLAPVHPGAEPRISHDPARVVELIERVGSPRVGMCFDVGHAHITGKLGALDAALPHVALFHLHDNLGARRAETSAPATVDPLTLDLHLPPGTGTVPWERLARHLDGHPAPLMMEIHAPHRPSALMLGKVTAGLLAGASAGRAA